jgi:hypothetical protein
LPVSHDAEERRDDLFPLALGLKSQLTYLADGTPPPRLALTWQHESTVGNAPTVATAKPVSALSLTHGPGNEEERPLAEIVTCSPIMADILALAGMTFRLRRPAGA